MDYPRFELARGYDDISLLPKRATFYSAGYDFIVAEDTVIPSYSKLCNILKHRYDDDPGLSQPLELAEMANITKWERAKPTLVPTGVKAYIPHGMYLQLQVRSSCPLKYWLILANGVGIIDADYYGNDDNDGEIFFQLINLSPVDIILRKGDKIGQGIFLEYERTQDDMVAGEKRTGGFGSTNK